MNINDSKYTYAYTNILINKFGIKNADKLKIAEFISVSKKIDFIATIQGDESQLEKVQAVIQEEKSISL